MIPAIAGRALARGPPAADNDAVSSLEAGSARRDLPVFTSGPDGHVVTYRLANGAQRALLVFIWVLILAAIFVQYWTSIGWDNFNPLAYPSFIIISAAVTYGLSVWFFNRRTVTIGDKTFSVRHGPLPFFLPRDEVRDIADVRRIRYDTHRAIQIKGNTLYFVRVAFRDGRWANLFTIFNDEALASRLVEQLRQRVAEKQAARLPLVVPDRLPELSERELARAEYRERLKLTGYAFAAVLCFAVVIALSEFAAARWIRPSLRARRLALQYEPLYKQLHSPDNYAVAIPARWETEYNTGGDPLRVTYGGGQKAFYRRLSDTFRVSLSYTDADKRLILKRADVEFVSATPCGRHDYFVAPLPKSALKREPTGTVSAETETLKTSGYKAEVKRDGEGVEWLCFDERPTPIPSAFDKAPTPPTPTPTPAARRH